MLSLNYMNDYIDRTIRAYDSHPEKFEAATKEMTPMEAFEKFVAQIPTNRFPVLDAGCAFGRDTALLASRGYQVIGTDISEALLQRACQLYPELEFINMDVRQLDFDD